MSVLVVGASHRTAPVQLLERLALDGQAAAKLRLAATETAHVTETVVLATCNRVEVYAEVARFHGGVDDLTRLLADHAGLPAEQLVSALYVHYDAGAVAHLFSVATGLDSMVVGESQILGQVRDALRAGQADDTVGTALNSLFQQGLRVGKRAHAETGIDRAGQSVVSVALGEAGDVVGGLVDASVCIIGAGSMAALAATSASRAGVSQVAVLSRTRANAELVAGRIGARAEGLDQLPREIAAADVLISCTGATGVVVPTELVVEALRDRRGRRPLAVVDLALPHDVAPGVAGLPGVTLIGLPGLAHSVHNGSAREDVAAVRSIVAEEVAAFAAARDSAQVAPTVVALRSMATGVVAAELDRLFARLPELNSEQQAEIAQTLRRVADKLLHEPTVRIKQLAGRTPDASYAEALAELFALAPSTVEAVSGGGEAS